MTHDLHHQHSQAKNGEAPKADPPSVWSALADAWDILFPLRDARVARCRSLIPPGGVFLDAGCGTGMLVGALLKEGIDALGFDLDPGFVDVAARNIPGQRVVRADLRGIDSVFPGRQFDVVASLGQTFPHLLTDSDVASFLEAARSRLAPEGILVLQVVSDAGAMPLRELPALEAPGLKLERRRRIGDGHRAWLDLRVVRGELVHEWTVEHRVWTPESLGAAARDAGFVVKWLAADESGKSWTGREPGFLQAFVPA